MSFLEKLKARSASLTLDELVRATSAQQPFDYEFVLFHALSQLGFLKRHLPFEDIHLYSSLVATLQLYSKYKPAVAYTVIHVPGGGHRFVIPSDRYVIKVQPDVEFAYEGDLYNSNEFILFTRMQSPLNLRRYVILQQWVATGRHLFNPEKYFTVRKEVVEENGVKRWVNVLYLKTTYMGNDVGVYFTKSWEIEDLPFFPQEDRAWLISYLTAKLKYQLGEIYSSYGAQIPSDAAPFSLNGTELKTEAQTTMEKLETELIQSSQKVLPFFG